MSWKAGFPFHRLLGSRPPTDEELLGYMDEALPAARMTEIEGRLRNSAETRQRLAILVRRRDQGGHTLGEIWRRHRITCAGREELGSYLLGTLDAGHAEYLRFHLEITGCRFCAANLQDLQAESKKSHQEIEVRRRRYFESSAGTLRKIADGDA